MHMLLSTGWTGFFVREFMGIELWRWAALLGVILTGFIVGKIASFFLERQAERLRQRDRLQVLHMLLSSMAGPVTLLALGIALLVAAGFMKLDQIGLGDAARKAATQPTTQAAEDFTFKQFWFGTCATLMTLAAAWFIYRLVDIVEFFLARWAAKTETLLDDQLVPLLRKALRVFVVIVAVVFITQNIFHFEIGPMLAGMGIGALAFAFAAKDLLANLFGAVVLFSDRPFHLGDRIKIAGYQGCVEEVGFRATRVRTLEGHLLTVPNALLANETIENVSSRPYIKRVLNVTVTYNTPPGKLHRGIEIIKEMCEARKEHFHPESPYRVFFSDFNADSLNIIVYMYFIPPDWWEYMAFTDAFNTELLERFNAEGIEFAFPTQTLYVKKGDTEK